MAFTTSSILFRNLRIWYVLCRKRATKNCKEPDTLSNLESSTSTRRARSTQTPINMEIRKPSVLRLTQIVLLVMISTSVMVNAAPIKIDFTTCKNSTYALNFLPNTTIRSLNCCPPLPTGPILDGLPRPMSKRLRVRQAFQCTDDVYRAKLEKAYALMKALPDDDPRSFTQQWHLHCAHCGGAFFSDPNNATTAIDVHFGWLFLPWHRFYLYFHERILQSLLGDPTFSLNFWNWDGPFTTGNGTSWLGLCNKAGADFPSTFQNTSSPLYDDNRSNDAKGTGFFPFPDLAFSNVFSAAQQYLPNITADDWIASNLNIMYQIMVSGGTTAPIFMGHPYREGDLKGFPAPFPTGGSGILEGIAHATVHFWTGMDPPIDLRDMGSVAFAARDPVFFSHHSNIDRLFQLWKEIGPLLGAFRTYWTDPDFLDAEFLFYDEKKNLWRVSPRMALDTRALGYVYQGTQLPWLDVNATRCSSLNFTNTLSQASAQPAPQKQSDGSYQLTPGTPFHIILDRPSCPQRGEEFLTVSGITLNRQNNGGFDVYVNLLAPTNFLVPTMCSEYAGRFTNMAVATYAYNFEKTFVFNVSLTRTLKDTQVPENATQLVVTIVPILSETGRDTIAFQDIFITGQ